MYGRWVWLVRLKIVVVAVAQKQYGRRQLYWCAVATALVVPVFFWLKGQLQPSLLGDGPTLQGGSLGRRIDNTHKRWLFYYQDWRYRRAFRSLTGGISVPNCPEPGANQQGVPVLLSTFYTAVLLSTQERQGRQQNIATLCPKCLFWPLLGDWFRPLPDNINNKNNNTFIVVPFLETEMDLWMIQHCSMELWELYQSLSLSSRIQLWALTMIHEYGGLFVGSNLVNRMSAKISDFIFNFSFTTNVMIEMIPKANVTSTTTNHDHDDKTEMAAGSVVWKTSLQDPNVLSFVHASMPKNPALGCLLHHHLVKHQQEQDKRQGTKEEEQSVGLTEFVTLFLQLYQKNTCKSVHVQNYSILPEEEDAKCCQDFLTGNLHRLLLPLRFDKGGGFTTAQLLSLGGQAHVLKPTTVNRVEILEPRQQLQQQGGGDDDSTAKTTIKTVTRTTNHVASTTSTTVPKQSHAFRMERAGCTPGWFCHRCLRMPWRGSLNTCTKFCSSCYIQQMTIDDRTNVLPLVHVDVRVKKTTHPKKSSLSTSSRIPRVIHQTWFEDLTVDNYPHLTRLQNSWKHGSGPGWEYRLYTDETAREYLIRNYPSRFARAYDALLPGAFKADFFRLLVLLKDGGVYADVDVQLDATNLDGFLSSSSISFFVPRDVPLDRWPDSNYCLWNGFMGAVPGHFIIVQAVQDLLNRIENRWDYYDMEHEQCVESRGDCEIWKLRSIPVLLLTGPCALGISVNKAMNRYNKLQGFDLGWMPNNQTGINNIDDDDDSHALILLTDRYDLGELRFTDVDRNLLVASTNADKTITFPLVSTQKKKSEHYSKSETDIMGSSGTYVDNLVTNEFVKLTIHHDDE